MAISYTKICKNETEQIILKKKNEDQAVIETKI